MVHDTASIGAIFGLTHLKGVRTVISLMKTTPLSGEFGAVEWLEL